MGAVAVQPSTGLCGRCCGSGADPSDDGACSACKASGNCRNCKGTGITGDEGCYQCKNQVCAAPTQPNVSQLRPRAATWPQPLPLEHIVAAFPVEALPEVLFDAAATVTAMLATPIDLPASAGLACVAAATRGQTTVACGNDWSVPLNLYALSIAAPGEAKTPALNEMVKPLRVAELRLASDTEADRRHQLVEHERAEARADLALKDMRAKPNDSEKAGLYEDALLTLADHPAPAAPRLLVGHDATPEALVSVMAAHGGATAVLTDEGAELFAIMGRYQSKQANTGIYLNGFDGQSYTRDRQNASTVTIPKAWLTIYATIQPGTLDTIRGDKNRQQGLLGRFLYFFPTSQVGRRPVGFDRPELDRDALDRYAAMLNRIIDGDRRQLRLTAEARARFDEWQHDHEPRLGPDGALHEIADWANKLDGQILRIAGALHIASTPTGDEVSAETLSAAVLIGDYLVSHALRAFDQMDETDEMATARKLLNAIRRNLPNESNPVVSERDVYRWARQKADDAAQGFKVLESYGWTRPVMNEYSGNGRPRSDTHELNPALFAPQHARSS